MNIDGGRQRGALPSGEEVPSGVRCRVSGGAARELLEQAFVRTCQIADPCWETWAAHGLGLHAAAAGDEASALSHLADAITRSRPQRGGHLWSHVWALTGTVPLARRAGDPRASAWHDEALTTAQRSGMRSLARDLLQLA